MVEGRRAPPELRPELDTTLGAVLEAYRLGVELERQLRAVRAHATDIAGSRRRLVAEMDAERRRIERDPARPALIKTVRGDGYSFVGAVHADPAP